MRPARRWSVAERIAAGLDLTLSQLLRLDEGEHVVVIRRGERRARRRGGHRTEELTPPLPGQRADRLAPPARARAPRPGAPATRPCTSPAAARPRSCSPARSSLLIDDAAPRPAAGRQRHLRRRPAAPLRQRRHRRRPSSSPWSPPACGGADVADAADAVRQDLGGARGRRRADLHRPAPGPRGHLAAGVRRAAARGPARSAAPTRRSPPPTTTCPPTAPRRRG